MNVHADNEIREGSQMANAEINTCERKNSSCNKTTNIQINKKVKIIYNSSWMCKNVDMFKFLFQ